MLLIFICVIISLVLFVVLGLHEGENRYDAPKFKICKRQIFSLIPLLLICINFLAMVPANHVGILYSPVSGVREETIPEGWNRKGLLDKVYKISTEVQTKNLENITGQTKDGQWVNMMIDVKYQVDPANAFQVFKQYKNLENVSNQLIAPIVQRSIESISTQYSVADILGSKRNDLYSGIEADLKTRLDENGIVFRNINITDMDAGDSIEAAIAAQAVAKQAVETAEQNRQKNEIDAQTRVVQAQADKQAAVLQAETRIIQAEAEAKVNRMMAESTTPLVIQRMEMQARLAHGWVTTQITGAVTPIVDTTK